MAHITPKTRQISRVSAATIKESRGLTLVVALATIQGFTWLGVFARMVLWNTNGLPDASLSSVFTNTAFFKTSLGQITVGDVSLWVERAVVLGIVLSLAYVTWRVRSRER